MGILNVWLGTRIYQREVTRQNERREAVHGTSLISQIWAEKRMMTISMKNNSLNKIISTVKIVYYNFSIVIAIQNILINAT